MQFGRGGLARGGELASLRVQFRCRMVILSLPKDV
jgi:hypothetical protein